MKTFIAAACALALALTGCSTAGPKDSSGSTTTLGKTTLTVFAAASLTDVFTTLGTDFTAKHPGVDVTFSFAGSADLVSQISEGAPADVVATADEKNMTTLADAKLLSGEPKLFTSNSLTLAVASGNPQHITTPTDFAGKDLVICAPQVPCGSATEKWASQNGVVLEPVSEENSVTDVLGKVSSGQADAGIVYVTDIDRADTTVEQVALPGADSVINLYPAAAVRSSAHQADAAAFVDYLRSEGAQKVLADAGFQKVP